MSSKEVDLSNEELPKYLKLLTFRRILVIPELCEIFEEECKKEICLGNF
jgi:hypothetical protein